jgi:hypothetical protein
MFKINREPRIKIYIDRDDSGESYTVYEDKVYKGSFLGDDEELREFEVKGGVYVDGLDNRTIREG